MTRGRLESLDPAGSEASGLAGKRVAVIVFSHYPSDPRPRRAAEALVRAGMQVDVISLKEHQGEPQREACNGVNILRVPLKRRRGGKAAYVLQYGWFTFVCFLLLALRMPSRRYRLVHVHNMPDFLVFAALVPKLCGARVMLDLHDPMPELMTTIYGLAEGSRGVRTLKAVEQRSIGFADVVLTVNQACKRIFSGRSCEPDKIRVVMNSPDERIFELREGASGGKNGADGERPFVIMYHGSIVERHGLDLAVTALETIRRSIPRAELRIYGQSTPFLEKVLARARESEARDSVHYLGPQKLEQIAGEIRQCDVGIIPNRRSIFTEINTPTRIFEYLSQGKPVIAPRVPGILDYFGPEDLVFFELGDADDLARKLEAVYWRPEEAESTVKRGQAIYRAHQWSRERERLLGTVRELLVDGRLGQGPEARQLELAEAGK